MTQAVNIAQLGSQGTSLGFKNRIINGAMVIDQRNAGASINNTTAGLYSVDRWKTYGAASAKFSVQQNAGSVTPPAGFVKYTGITSLAATTVGSSDEYDFYQLIEGYNMADLNWGSANAKTVTLSFWVRSSLTGNFGGSLRNTAASRSFPFLYTINAANTWEQKSVTVTGCVDGVWETTNSTGIILLFDLGCGSTLKTTANAWANGNYLSATGTSQLVATSGATFYITGVQLEVGSSATGFEYRQYGQELALCQRYFEKSFKPSTPPADNSGEYSFRYTHVQSGYGTFVPVRFSVTKRADPTVTIYNPVATGAGKPIDSATSNPFTNVFIQSPHPNGFAGHWYSGSADGTGNPVAFNFTASAEL